MKKIYTIFATLAMLCAVGCEEQGVQGDNIVPGNGNSEQPSDGNQGDGNQEETWLELDKTDITISPAGGSVNVKVRSNHQWEIEGGENWCTPSIKRGNANENGQTVTFSADANYETSRNATFWFHCATEKTAIVVSQDFKEVIIADKNNTFDIPAEGGVAVINYQTSVECEIVIPYEAQDWITITSIDTTRALESASAALAIAENTTNEARSAVIRVENMFNSSMYAEYTIHQAQNDVVTGGGNTFDIGGWAQTITLDYQTNTECEVVIPAGIDWISTSSNNTKASLEHQSHTIHISDNNTGAERSAVVRIVAKNNDALAAEYTITQNRRYFIQYEGSLYCSGAINIKPSAFDANIVNHTFDVSGFDEGFIEFDGPVTKIGDYAFQNFKELSSIILPDSIKEIGRSAFCNCEYLYEVNIPNGVVSIGNGAFSGCTLLERISIPDSATSIGKEAFYDCYYLESVTIGEGVTTIEYKTFASCDNLVNLTIGNSVTTIGEGAFELCEKLADVVIPNCVTTIEKDAFSCCSGLMELIIGNGVRTIGDSAFELCNGLTSITIPESVTDIGAYAFFGCKNLSDVYCMPTTPPSGGNGFFDSYWLCNIYVPSASVATYKSATYWSNFANKITGYDF